MGDGLRSWEQFPGPLQGALRLEGRREGGGGV